MSLSAHRPLVLALFGAACLIGSLPAGASTAAKKKPAAPVEAPLADLAPEQVANAERVHVGDQDCEFRHAYQAIECTSAGPTLENVTIRNCQRGVFLDGNGQPVFDTVDIDFCQYSPVDQSLVSSADYTTTCSTLKKEPAQIATKEQAFESRFVRTQPRAMMPGRADSE